MTTFNIRKSKKEDIPEILSMIKELAEFEGFSDITQLTEKDLEYDGFVCIPPRFKSFVAEDTASGKLIGHVLFSNVYSSWVGYSTHIEDFYVKPECRKHGIGRQLFQEVCKEAQQTGSSCLNWITSKDNKNAIRFYDNLGARNITELENRIAYKMDKAVLSALCD